MVSKKDTAQDKTSNLAEDKVAIWQRFVWWNKKTSKLPNQESYKIVRKIKQSLARKGTTQVLDNRPWYLLIGTESGKTSSLLYSDLEPIAPNEQKIGSIIKTSDIDAWQDNEKIILECSSDIFNDKKKRVTHILKDLPQSLKLLNPPNGIDSIIIMLKADDFSATPEKFAKICKTIADTCKLFSSASSRLPIHLIINQCNTIPGFSEIFTEKKYAHHLLQICINSSGNIIERVQREIFNFNKKFQDFVTLQLIDTDDNGYAEQLVLARSYFETIANRLPEIISAIDWNCNLALCNISFCSVIKNPIIKHDISEGLLEMPEYNALIQGDEVFKPKFVRETLAQINSASAQTSKRDFVINYQPIIAIATMIIIAAACWAPIQTHFYKHNNLLNKVISTIKTNDNQDAAASVTQLQKAAGYITDHYKNKNFKNKKIYKLVTAKLNYILQNDFAKGLFATVGARLSEQTSSNSNKLYNTLKAYLMLHNLGPMNYAFVENWFQEDWAKSQKWAASEQIAMIQALDTLLRAKIQNIPSANIGLIDRARNSLDRLPIQMLAYNILTNSAPPGGIDLNKAVPHSSDIHLQISDIPSIYTIQNSSKMLNQIIPNIMLLINTQDWVIQKNIGKKITGKNSTAFISQIKQLYLNDYAQKWMQIFNGITLSPAQNLEQVQRQIQELSSPDSTLWGILNILLRNTNNNNQNTDFYKQITAQFTGIDGLNPSNFDNNTVQTNLKTFSEFIKEIQSSADIKKSEFNVASNRATATNASDPISLLNNLATEQPSAVANWLTVVSNSAWQNIMQGAAEYINQYWQKNIYPYWQSKLKNRFPLDYNSTNNIEIADFNNFFAPSGKIDNFITAYIKPFISTQSQLWQWKSLDGIKLPLNPVVLNDFIKSNLLQKMFYSENVSDAQATANISLLYSKPRNINVIWTNDNNIIELGRSRRSNKIIANIPSSAKQSIAIKSSHNKKDSGSLLYSSSGQWSIMQLLKNAKISSTRYPNQYIAEFISNNYIIKLHIQFLQNNNPLLPGLLHPFDIPETLLIIH